MDFSPTFTHSEDLEGIAGALAVAQGAMDGAKKSATNPHLKTKYADLASCLDSARGPLADNGLAVSQIIVPGSPTYLVTMLLHSSGQWLRSSLVLETEDHKGLSSMQSLGLAISYLRRYSFQAIIGQTSEDDDGHEGDGNKAPGDSTAGSAEKSNICPACGAAAIIKGKEEYGGGWLCFKAKGGCGTKFAEHPADTIAHKEAPPAANAQMNEAQIARFHNSIADMTFELPAHNLAAVLTEAGTSMNAILAITGSEEAAVMYGKIEAALKTLEPGGQDDAHQDDMGSDRHAGDPPEPDDGDYMQETFAAAVGHREENLAGL